LVVDTVISFLFLFIPSPLSMDLIGLISHSNKMYVCVYKGLKLTQRVKLTKTRNMGPIILSIPGMQLKTEDCIWCISQ